MRRSVREITAPRRRDIVCVSVIGLTPALAETGTLATIPVRGWGGKGYAACCQAVNPADHLKIAEIPEHKPEMMYVRLGLFTTNLDCGLCIPFTRSEQSRYIYMYVVCKFYPHPTPSPLVIGVQFRERRS